MDAPMSSRTNQPEALPNGARPRPKLPTGIEGFDAITGGGLPRGRTTLVMGEPGAGKTIFALQALAHQARVGVPGIFVAFEERVDDIAQYAESFGWDVARLRQQGRLYFLDAHFSPDLIRTGGFDFNGLLASLKAKRDEMGAKAVVFDAIDVVLRHLDDPVVRRQEVYRLHNWLVDSDVTGLLTVGLEPGSGEHPYGVMQAIADCVIQLTHRLVDRVLLRELRVLKYRGSPFLANEFPIVIGPHGMEVAALAVALGDYPVSTERVSSGVERLDEMLGGGFLRGTSILITGAPGTAKSTLAGSFAAAACRRGERVLLLSFDEVASEILRNLRSVGIELAPHVEAGLLRLHSGRIEATSAEEHLIGLKTLLETHQPRCVVIDPLSAIIKAGGAPAALSMAKRLLHLAKSRGITLVCTSLLDSGHPDVEATPLQISTLSDTWLHLSYQAVEGERNRALTIVKARGTWHSNQVRELVLSAQGVTLTDVYTAEGRVLMGTARWQQEQREAQQRERERAETERRRIELEQTEAELLSRLQALEHELKRSRAERLALEQTVSTGILAQQRHDDNLRRLRGVATQPAGTSDSNHKPAAVPQPRRRRSPRRDPQTGGGA
jgi:circadian clock protein KaiC